MPRTAAVRGVSGDTIKRLRSIEFSGATVALGLTEAHLALVRTKALLLSGVAARYQKPRLRLIGTLVKTRKEAFFRALRRYEGKDLVIVLQSENPSRGHIVRMWSDGKRRLFYQENGGKEERIRSEQIVVIAAKC